MRERLLFGGVAQIRAHMAASGKNDAGYPAIISLQETQYPIGEDQADGVSAQADLTHGVNLRAIDTKRVHRFIDFPGPLGRVGQAPPPPGHAPQPSPPSP